MKNLLANSGWLTAGVLALSLSAGAQVTLFDNTTSPSPNQIFPGTTSAGNAGYTLEYGNQVFFGNGYTAESITSFAFDYYAISANGTSFAGTPTVDVRWYLNTGAPFNTYATPGSSPFYDSGPVSLASSTLGSAASPGNNALTFSVADGDFPSGGQFVAGNELTWTVQFSGMGLGDNLGVVLAGLPTVPGTSLGNDYWLNNSGWTLQENEPTANDNFAQTWVGNAVPEPSTLTATLAATKESLTISWTPAGESLYSSPALASVPNWTLVTTNNPATVPITGPAMFFRVGP